MGALHWRTSLRGLGFHCLSCEVHWRRHQVLPKFPHHTSGHEVQERTPACTLSVHGLGGCHACPCLTWLEDYEVLWAFVHSWPRLACRTELPLRPNLCSHNRHGGKCHTGSCALHSERTPLHELR